MDRSSEMDLFKMAGYRSHVYGVLGACFAGPPDKALLGWLRRTEVSNILADMGLHTGTLTEEENEADILATLLDDYNTLYAPLAGCVATTESEILVARTASSKKAEAVKMEVCGRVAAVYADMGFSPPQLQGPCDQIGIEFEFMRLLTYREATQWRKRNGKNALALLKVQRGFAAEHLASWVPPFERSTKKNAKVPLYPQMAELARRFVAVDVDFLLNKAPDEKALASAS